MEMHTRHAEDAVILELSGRFDAYTAPPVAEWLEKIVSAQSANVIVDLTGVHFIDSTALAILVQGMKRCRQHQGDLRLRGLQPSVRIIFELTRLDRAFQIDAKNHATPPSTAV